MSMYKRTAFVPNTLFDDLLPTLSKSELKVLLVVVRQTNGWKRKHSNQRKLRDRITKSQFVVKTGLSKKSISDAIASLVAKQVLVVSDRDFNVLSSSEWKGCFIPILLLGFQIKEG